MIEIAGGILIAVCLLPLIPLAIGAAVVVGPLLLAITMVESGNGWRMFFSYPIYAIYAVVGIVWLSRHAKDRV